MSDELPPAPKTFVPAPGVEVERAGRHSRIIASVDLGRFLVEDIETGERILVGLSALKLWTGPPDTARRMTRNLEELTPRQIEVGQKRLAVIERLLAMPRRTRADVGSAATELNLAGSTLYALIKDYQNEGSITSVIPYAEYPKTRVKRLSPEIDAIITAAINNVYLNDQKAKPAVVIREVNIRCKRASLIPPNPNTVRARIGALNQRQVVTKREGAKAARDRFGPVIGAAKPPLWPLQVVEIDHTVADFFIVDNEFRMPIARPIITLMIDSFSRCVLGFYLTLEKPSTLSVALALSHGMLPKTEYCRKHGILTPWDICGIPDTLFSDNAAEFDSHGLQLGCQHYGIHGLFRPLGQPQFGGRIERLVGTMMGKVRLLPGATFSSIKERGDNYDPEKHAAYTIEEAETRVAMMIAEEYHQARHGGIGISPIKMYEFGVFGDDRTPGRGFPRQCADPSRVLIDFLPLQKRTVQEYGLQVNGLRYYRPILKSFMENDDGQKYNVRHDPRDVTRVWFQNPVDHEYYEIALANSFHKPAALWEVNRAIQYLKDQGVDHRVEESIFAAINRGREMDDAAKLKTKKARLDVERRSQARKVQPPAPSVASVADMVEADRANPEPGLPKPRIKPIDDVEGW